jgi:hypothetical protein
MAREQGMIINEREYEQPQEPLGKRIGRFVTLMGIVFAISGGIIVTQRLSEDTLALLIGLSCGIAAMLPTILIGWLWLKKEAGMRDTVEKKNLEQTVLQPPVIVVAPQALPGYMQSYGQPALSATTPQSTHWEHVPAAREFKIVGGMD